MCGEPPLAGEPPEAGSLLVVGATGVVGSGVLQRLLSRCENDGWDRVYCVSRDPSALPPHPRIVGVAADALDAAALRRAIAPFGAGVRCVVNCAAVGVGRDSAFATKDVIAVRRQLNAVRPAARTASRVPLVRRGLWRRVADECGMTRDVCARNVALVRNLLDALRGGCPGVEHVVQVTGAKASGMHLGPLWPHYAAPLEEEPAHLPPGPNWYFAAEAAVRAAAEEQGWGWTVLRPSFVASAQPAGLNLAAGVALLADHCRREGARDLRFPGGAAAWDAIHSLTTTDTIADMARWRCAQGRGPGGVLNCVTSEFQWSQLWPAIAGYFALAPAGPAGADGEACAAFDTSPACPVRRWYVDAVFSIDYDTWLCPQRAAAHGWQCSVPPWEALSRCFDAFAAAGLIERRGGAGADGPGPGREPPVPPDPADPPAP